MRAVVFPESLAVSVLEAFPCKVRGASVLPVVTLLALVLPIVIAPPVPVADPVSIDKSPEFEVAPLAFPDLIVRVPELVLDVDVSAVLKVPLSVRSRKGLAFEPRSMLPDPGSREVLMATDERLDNETLAPPAPPPKQFPELVQIS